MGFVDQFVHFMMDLGFGSLFFFSPPHRLPVMHEKPHARLAQLGNPVRGPRDPWKELAHLSYPAIFGSTSPYMGIAPLILDQSIFALSPLSLPN